jgi:hypothetical protein
MFKQNGNRNAITVSGLENIPNTPGVSLAHDNQIPCSGPLLNEKKDVGI